MMLNFFTAWECVLCVYVCVRRCCWYVVCTAVWADECQLLRDSLVLYYLLCHQFVSLYNLHDRSSLSLTGTRSFQKTRQY